MQLGRVSQVSSFREWVVSVQRAEEEALAIERGTFVRLESGLVGCVVDAEQKVPDEYVGRDIADDDVTSAVFPGNIVDRSYYLVLGLGTSDGFEVDRQPRLRESVNKMTDDEVREFHRSDGSFSISYVSDLLDYSLTGPEATVAILTRVQDAVPEQEELLESLKTHARRVVDE